MASYPTPAETAQFIDDLLRGLIDPSGTGAYNNRPGSDNAALISLLTKVATKQYAYSADRKKASITVTSEGTDLEDHIRDVYFDEKKAASISKGTVYLKRTGAMLATSVDLGTRFGTKKTDAQKAVPFESTIAVPAALGVSAIAIPVKCQLEGEIGNVDLLTVTEKLDPLDDAAWTLYVPLAGDPVLAGAPRPDVISGGQEAETDDDVKARVLRRPAKAIPGTGPGVYKGTTDVQGIISAVPIELGDGTGVVYAGDVNDQLSSAKQAEVTTNLEDWRPFGVPVAVRSYNRTLVQVVARVYMQQPIAKNYDLNALKTNGIAAIKRYFKIERIRLDEYFVDAIKTAIGKANAQTQSVILDAPTLDVRRSADFAYGVIAQLSRYYVDDTSISLQFFDPLTS